MAPRPHSDEVRVCTECGHYMRKATIEEFGKYVVGGSEDPEFYDLWICECGHRYHDLVVEY